MANEPQRLSLARLLVFAFLPLMIGWMALECLAFAYFHLRSGFLKPRPQLMFMPHPYRVFELAPDRIDQSGHASHNSKGLRNPDFAEIKPPGTVRIVCLGGSTTYSIGATTDTHTYPAHLERFLRQHYAQTSLTVEVINAGAPTYSSLESLILFQTRMLEYSPDVAILHNSLNDAWVATNFTTYSGDYSHARHTFGPLGMRVWECSPLLSLLFARSTTPFNPHTPNPGVDLVAMIHYKWESEIVRGPKAREERANESADVLERNAVSFIATARGNGIIPVLATETWRDTGGFNSRVVSLFNERLRTVAARERIPLIDFAREMPWNPRAFFDMCHLSDRPDGLERKGKIFADALIRAGVIEQAAVKQQ